MDKYVNYICKKTGSKSNAVAPIVLFMNFVTNKMLHESVHQIPIEVLSSQWLYYNKQENNVHEKALRTTLSDKLLLPQEYSITIVL